MFTSSCLTILFAEGNETRILDENDWSDVTKCFHYPKSKILAEKAAWNIYEKNKDKIQFVSVLPSLVLGPLYSKHGNSSEAILVEILNGSKLNSVLLINKLINIRLAYPGIPKPDCTY